MVLRYRDNFRNAIGEEVFEGFLVFLKRDFVIKSNQISSNPALSDSLSPQTNYFYNILLYDDNVPTVSGYGALSFDYDTGYFYHPKVYSWLDNGSTGQNLHYGSHRGYRNSVPARVDHPTYFANRGQTYCMYTEYTAVQLNLFAEEKPPIEYSFSPEAEIDLGYLQYCRTYPNLPPTPTPTPTPTPSCTPGKGEELVPCPTVTPTPTPTPTPTVKITEVGFTGDRLIRQFEVNGQPYIDSPDGTTATWKSNDNPKFPVAYQKGSNPTLFAKFSITPTLTTNQSAKIQVKKGNTVITSPADATLIGNEFRVDGINIPFSNLESAEYIKKEEYEFTWEISFDNGSTWKALDKKSKHDIHWLYSNPSNENDFKPFVNSQNNQYQGLFDKALEWTTGKIDKNESNIQKVVQKINDKIHNEIIYKPNKKSFNGNPLGILTGENDGEAVCWDNALVLSGLLKSIGLPGIQEKYHWGGTESNSKRNYYCPPGGCGTVTTEEPLGYRITMQTKRDQLGCNGFGECVERNPSFAYHATVIYDNRSFDPSYGINEGAIELLTAVNVPTTGQPQCVHNSAATALLVSRNAFGTSGIAANNDTNKICTPVLSSIHSDPKSFRFDGQGGADIAIVRGTTGEWLTKDESQVETSLGSLSFNSAQDAMAPADYDGDGLTDPAVWYSNGDFFYRMSSNYYKQSGGFWRLRAGDEKAVPGDYDGDHISDLAAWRASDGKWIIRRSSDNADIEISWGGGALGDVPVPGDYDGDGKTDIAVWRSSNGIWYIIKSSDGSYGYESFGAAEDIPVQGDYDGDGKTDYAVVRPSTGIWYFLKSENNYQFSAYQGPAYTEDTILVPADYNADSKTDIAIWFKLLGEWHIVDSQTGEIRQEQLGDKEDVPIVSASVFQ